MNQIPYADLASHRIRQLEQLLEKEAKRADIAERAVLDGPELAVHAKNAVSLERAVTCRFLRRHAEGAIDSEVRAALTWAAERIESGTHRQTEEPLTDPEGIRDALE